MLIDHIGLVFFPEDSVIYAVCRLIGRVSFPIFAFLIAEGAYYTKNRARYAARLGAFALVSEFFYDLSIHNTAIDFNSQNIYFTLLLGLLSIIGYEYFVKKNLNAVGFVFPLFCSFVAEDIRSGYGFFGVLLIFIFYITRKNKIFGFVFQFLGVGALSFDLNGNFNLLQFFGISALVFICFYNKQKGASINKYIFYLFYPAHLLILYLINLVITQLILK
jgi:hypothetical protein